MATTAQKLPLHGIRVLDLSRALSGPYCSMVLADLGAEVTKVEPAPGGDLIRMWGPKQQGVTLYYMAANRNKRSVLVDFRSDEGPALLRRMADRADIVIENFRPGVMAAMQLDYETLAATNPRLIYASISGFGHNGPKSSYPGFDIIAQAMSGVMSVNGESGTDPLRVGVPLGDMAAGMWLVIGIQAALRHRDQTGCGQRVETSLLATLVNMLSYHAQGYLSLGRVPQRTGNTHAVIQPYGAYRAADGLMVIAPGTHEMWSALCETLGAPLLVGDPRFAEPTQRVANAAQLKHEIEARLRSDTAANWTARMLKAGIPAAPIKTVGEALDDEQVLHDGLIETVEHPVLGPVKLVANPYRLSSAPRQTTRRHPPAAGEHTVECLREFGFTQAEIDAWLRSGAVRCCGASPAAHAGATLSSQGA